MEIPRTFVVTLLVMGLAVGLVVAKKATAPDRMPAGDAVVAACGQAGIEGTCCQKGDKSTCCGCCTHWATHPCPARHP
jgi:hypothetical protein